MPFNIQTWKTDFQSQVQGWKKRLDRAGTNSVYYFLAATSLLPVVRAAHSGDWGSLAVLGTALGGAISTNLLANMVQKLKDKHDNEIAKELEQEVHSNPEVKLEIDALLEALNVLKEAEYVLTPEDKLWFEKTIREELKRIGSGLKYDAIIIGDGAIAQGDRALAAGPGATIIQNSTIIFGAGKIQVEENISQSDALTKYLNNLIATHQHLHLQGIRAGSKPLNVALENVYISLSAIDLQYNTDLSSKDGDEQTTASVELGSALKRYRRLVIVGDPGCGKTTLISFLILTYARAYPSGNVYMRERASLVKRREDNRKSLSADKERDQDGSPLSSQSIKELEEEQLKINKGIQEIDNELQKNLMTPRLGIAESDHIPVFLPLRNFGDYLARKTVVVAEDGPSVLLDYLFEYYSAQKISLPRDFFDAFLETGKAAILLDGLDEVPDIALRQRLARIIEKFAHRYPECRFVVTSREVGYEGSIRIGANFGLTKVQDLNQKAVHQFIRDWTHTVEITLSGVDTPEINRLADDQANKLIRAIESNQRVAELAVNPLLLTVIALVHRYRAQLPERRSELYEEGVEVLLGHWDQAKEGMGSELEIGGIKMDSGDRRSLLEPIAFWLHERERREIEYDELFTQLVPTFKGILGSDKLAVKAMKSFVHVINERSGLLIERGPGIYGFAHLTFQEYLAARALADRKDALNYTLRKLNDPWWREVILLETGYLSTQGKRRVSELIRAIVDTASLDEPEPYHNLILAAECLFDVGATRIEGDLMGEIRRRLQDQANSSIILGDRTSVLRKVTAMNALARIESGKVISRFWEPPYGEPEWITIPEGEFWMGSKKRNDEMPIHRVYLPPYRIARVPITNAQYAIYAADANVDFPVHWHGKHVPKGLENHPVVNVTWSDAENYCKWLEKKLNKSIALPSEAEWEKAARGDSDERQYPWGDWTDLRANTRELGLGETNPVGLFLNGASPYGVLEMVGNVQEWTRNVSGYDYPYSLKDERESLLRRGPNRMVRGGAFINDKDFVTCSMRGSISPILAYDYIGLRVVTSSLPS